MTEMADKKQNTEAAPVESAEDTQKKEEEVLESSDQAAIDSGAELRTREDEVPEVEILPDELEAAQVEIAELKDKLLRLAAEFDNFRKRVGRERLEQRKKAQAELVELLLEGLDDLGRVAHLDPEQTTVEDLLAGVELVERKLLKELAAGGLKRIGELGEPFDPNVHEAVSTRPAANPEQDHTVAQVLKMGYQFDGVLLRPAIVEVFIAQGD